MRTGVLLVAEQLRRGVPGRDRHLRARSVAVWRWLDDAHSSCRRSPCTPAVTAATARPRPRLRPRPRPRPRPRQPDPLEGFGRPLIVVAPARARAHPGCGTGPRATRRAASTSSTPCRWPCRRPGTAPARVVTVHDVAWRHRPEDFPSRGRRWHEAALRPGTARRAAHFVVPSEAVAARRGAGRARPRAACR